MQSRRPYYTATEFRCLDSESSISNVNCSRLSPWWHTVPRCCNLNPLADPPSPHTAQRGPCVRSAPVLWLGNIPGAAVGGAVTTQRLRIVGDEPGKHPQHRAVPTAASDCGRGPAVKLQCQWRRPTTVHDRSVGAGLVPRDCAGVSARNACGRCFCCINSCCCCCCCCLLLLSLLLSSSSSSLLALLFLLLVHGFPQ